MKDRLKDKLPEKQRLRSAILEIPGAKHIDADTLKVLKGATASLTHGQVVTILNYRDARPTNGHPFQIRGRGVGSNYR